MSSPTPLNEFKKSLPDKNTLKEDQIELFRDLIDAQANLILDSFIAEKAKQQQKVDDTIK